MMAGQGGDNLELQATIKFTADEASVRDSSTKAAKAASESGRKAGTDAIRQAQATSRRAAAPRVREPAGPPSALGRRVPAPIQRSVDIARGIQARQVRVQRRLRARSRLARIRGTRGARAASFGARAVGVAATGAAVGAAAIGAIGAAIGAALLAKMAGERRVRSFMGQAGGEFSPTIARMRVRQEQIDRARAMRRGEGIEGVAQTQLQESLAQLTATLDTILGPIRALMTNILDVIVRFVNDGLIELAKLHNVLVDLLNAVLPGNPAQKIAVPSTSPTTPGIPSFPGYSPVNTPPIIPI